MESHDRREGTGTGGHREEVASGTVHGEWTLGREAGDQQGRL